MFTFPEEQLASPVGYFAAQPGQLLNNGCWKIIRKLGWGTRSSTWLAEYTARAGVKERNSAIKIFTHKATTDPSTAREMEILEHSRNWGSSYHFPMLQQHFVEKSSWGEHLCLVLLPQGASLESLRFSNAEGGYLPLHVVKNVASETLEIIDSLHTEKIIHGDITADNILLAPQAGWEEDLPRSTNIEMKNVVVDGLVYPVVFSQPLPHGLEWNSSREDISDLEIILGGFGHAQSLGPNISLDATQNILPPEAISGRGVDRKADIWMFGCMIYHLLTGSPLFSSELPLSIEDIEQGITKIEEHLAASKKLSDAEVPATAAFLKSCLTVDTKKRRSANDLSGDKWVMEGHVCSCGYCSADPPL